MAISRQDKIVWGTGAAALVGLTLLAIAFKEKPNKSSGKKNYGLTVDPQCNSFTVNNETLIRDGIRAEVRLLSKKGSADPFEVTRAFLRKAAPHCTTYPNNVRNPGEAALFVLTFNSTLDVMEDEKLLSNAQMATFKNMVKVWAIDQGVSPEDF